MRQQNIRKLINTYSQHNRTKQQFHTELSKRWIDGSMFFMQLFHNFVWAHSTFMVVSVTCLLFLCRQSLVCMYPSLVLYVGFKQSELNAYCKFNASYKWSWQGLRNFPAWVFCVHKMLWTIKEWYMSSTTFIWFSSAHFYSYSTNSQQLP